jgi:hypothetical protein
MKMIEPERQKKHGISLPDFFHAMFSKFANGHNHYLVV